MIILEIEVTLCFAFPNRIQETQCAVETPVVYLSLPWRSLLGHTCLTEAPSPPVYSQGEERPLERIHHSY